MNNAWLKLNQDMKEFDIPCTQVYTKYMSAPKLERNKLLVKLRRAYEQAMAQGKKPKKDWTWEALRIEFKFKSRNAAREIYLNFKDRF